MAIGDIPILVWIFTNAILLIVFLRSRIISYMMVTIFVKKGIRELFVKVAISMQCFGMNTISSKISIHARSVLS